MLTLLNTWSCSFNNVCMPTNLYLTAHNRPKRARLIRSSTHSILLDSILLGCRQVGIQKLDIRYRNLWIFDFLCPQFEWLVGPFKNWTQLFRIATWLCILGSIFWIAKWDPNVMRPFYNYMSQIRWRETISWHHTLDDVIIGMHHQIKKYVYFINILSCLHLLVYKMTRTPNSDLCGWLFKFKFKFYLNLKTWKLFHLNINKRTRKTCACLPNFLSEIAMLGF